ncbi:MAG: hypothetical protein AB9903_26940 [Vulcanimicrobiota bacterium]
MAIQLFPLSSELHDADRLEESYRPFIDELEKALNEPLQILDSFSEEHDDLTVFFIKTGGVEEKFRALVHSFNGPFLLLAGAVHNSLAASCEILSYLRTQGQNGEIIHGSPRYMAERLQLHRSAYLARKRLSRARLGVIGAPSSWLIASKVDYQKARSLYGVELIDIPIEHYLERIGRCEAPDIKDSYGLFNKRFDESSLSLALKAYGALKSLVEEHDLQGLTLRCFDMLDSIRTTGCIALSILNSEGTPAACEGDVPALISMVMMKYLTGEPVFMANPSQVDIGENTVIMAHCTVPLSMVQRYCLDTHFESGLGVAVAGNIASGPVTVFKLSSDCEHYFLSGAELRDNLNESTLCRTQIRLFFEEDVRYFLVNPLGNHHLICRGAHDSLLRCLLENAARPVMILGR